MPLPKPLTKEQIIAAMGVTKSNRAAARWLNVSYIHYKKWAKNYKDEETGKTLFEKHLLWLMRRIEDDEYLDYIWRLIKEGFDFDDPCDYESPDEYLDAILYGSVTTFINSYKELYNVYPAEVFDEMYDFIRDFMIEKYGDKIKSHYISYREICDEQHH